MQARDAFYEKAHALITSPAAKRAFDLEPANRIASASPMAATRFGQSCLLARRLIEAGVHFVTVTDGGWDTHQNNFRSLKERAAAAAGPGLRGPAAGPARPRPAGQHAGRLVRRFRPHAEGQSVGRPRPLGHRRRAPAWAAAASRRGEVVGATNALGEVRHRQPASARKTWPRRSTTPSACRCTPGIEPRTAGRSSWCPEGKPVRQLVG